MQMEAIANNDIMDAAAEISRITVSVADKGPGMQLYHIQRIMSPEYRNVSLTPGQSGGAGLAISQVIIQGHGGTLACQSSVGRGSTFSFTIPFKVLAKDESDMANLKWSPDRPSRISSSDQGSKGKAKSHSVLSDSSAGSRGTNKSLRKLSSIHVSEDDEQSEEMKRIGGGSGGFMALPYIGKVDPSTIPVTARVKAKVVQRSFIPWTFVCGSIHEEPKKAPNNTEMLDPDMPTDGPETPVLIIDTSLSHSKMFALLLKRRMCDAVTMNDNDLAILDVEQDPDRFSIVFVDSVSSCSLTGMQTAKIMRGVGYRNLLVGMTSYNMDNEVSDFVTAGADFVILKPLSMVVLTLLLKHLAERGPESRWESNLKLQIMGNSQLEWVDK